MTIDSPGVAVLAAASVAQHKWHGAPERCANAEETSELKAMNGAAVMRRDAGWGG